MPVKHKQIVCLNGHQISDSTDLNTIVEGYCETCGSPLISECQNCKTPIEGKTYYPNFVDMLPYSVPKYCKSCGKPFPWTKSAIEAAEELIDFSELSETEKNDAKDSVGALITDSPKTKVASAKLKVYLKKGGSFLSKGLYDILVDIVSESAKKIIWGG